MKQPKYTDTHRGRYRTAEESRTPGYLARRFAELRRAREDAEQAEPKVTQLSTKRVARGGSK